MHLTLHLTRACNLRCDYCYAPPRADAGMSENVAIGSLKFGSRWTKGSCGIVFFGGEPLLYEGLIRRIVAASHLLTSKGEGVFHFKLTTNGLLLNEDFLEFSIGNDVLVAISFDGLQYSHDRHRRMPDGSGSFAAALPKLKLLLAARPYSSVLMVVNPDTVGQLSENVQFLAELGARYLVISLNYAADWDESSLEELEDACETLGDVYLQWSRDGRKFFLSPLEVKLASHILGESARCNRCELGVRQLSVDPDGFLYPCVQFARTGPESRWCIGHVNRGIDHVRREQLRNASESVKESCRGCEIRGRCQNTCGCLNWQTTGSVSTVSPVLCRSEQILTRVADRVGAQLFAEQNPRFLQKHYNPAYPILSVLEDANVLSLESPATPAE